jgi:putative transposase
VIVQPDTVLRWHRELFRWVWRLRSRPRRRGKPPLTADIVDLIRQMAQQNLSWGAERIRVELLKLGLQVSKSAIQKYIYEVRKPGSPKQTWATFLRNHTRQIWACDFIQTYDVFLRTLFVFVIVELGSRRLVHFGVTKNPTDAWVAQQLREATPFAQGPCCLIRDNDRKYGRLFTRVASGTGIEVLQTPIRAPKANAICERFIGSLKRECLDHMLILHANQLHHIVRSYVKYYNHSRPHQGIEQRVPAQFPRTNPPSSGPIIARPVLGGLHHTYSRAAYLH